MYYYLRGILTNLGWDKPWFSHLGQCPARDRHMSSAKVVTNFGHRGICQCRKKMGLGGDWGIHAGKGPAHLKVSEILCPKMVFWVRNLVKKEVNSPIGIVAITYIRGWSSPETLCEPLELGWTQIMAKYPEWCELWLDMAWTYDHGRLQSGCGLGLKPLDHVGFPWGYPNSWLVYKSL